MTHGGPLPLFQINGDMYSLSKAASIRLRFCEENVIPPQMFQLLLFDVINFRTILMIRFLS